MPHCLPWFLRIQNYLSKLTNFYLHTVLWCSLLVYKTVERFVVKEYG